MTGRTERWADASVTQSSSLGTSSSTVPSSVERLVDQMQSALAPEPKPAQHAGDRQSFSSRRGQKRDSAQASWSSALVAAAAAQRSPLPRLDAASHRNQKRGRAQSEAHPRAISLAAALDFEPRDCRIIEVDSDAEAQSDSGGIRYQLIRRHVVAVSHGTRVNVSWTTCERLRWWFGQSDLHAGEYKGDCTGFDDLEKGGIGGPVACGIVKMAASNPGALWKLLNNNVGTWIVQLAVDVWSNTEVRPPELMQVLRTFHQPCESGLPGQTLLEEACASPYASHVLSRCIEVVEMSELSFLPEKLIEDNPVADTATQLELPVSDIRAQRPSRHCRGRAVALNRYGSRIFEKLLSRGQGNTLVGKLCQRVLDPLEDVHILIRHQYGNHVLQSILQHGPLESQNTIGTKLLEELFKYCTHRIGSHVVQRAVSCVQGDMRCRLLEEIEAMQDRLLDRPTTSGPKDRPNYAQYVVQAVQKERRSDPSAR